MEKPIKPKKPQKVVLRPPVSESYIGYKVVQSRAGRDLRLTQDLCDSAADDFYQVDRVNLGDLIKLCNDLKLDINQITLEVSNDYDDSYFGLSYILKFSEEDQKKNQASYLSQKEILVKAYQTALAAYPQALEDYQTKKAEYDVWAAQQKLASLKKK